MNITFVVYVKTDVFEIVVDTQFSCTKRERIWSRLGLKPGCQKVDFCLLLQAEEGHFLILRNLAIKTNLGNTKFVDSVNCYSVIVNSNRL